MGFWINNFVEFESKQNRENRLILNFYYLPEAGEDPRQVKVYVPHQVVIPSNFVHDGKVEELEDKLAQDETLSKFPFTRKKQGKFSVFQIAMPNDHRVINQLDRNFQIGNYDRLLRFSGFHPERKVTLSDSLEDMFSESEELNLEPEDMAGIEFGDFLSVDDLENAPRIYIDIEKPLWKNEREKRLLNARKKYLRQEKSYSKKKTKTEREDQLHARRLKAIPSLEAKLTINVEGVGDVRLYEERFDADVSFVSTIWKSKDGEVRELYVLDPNSEISQEQERGYNILKFKTEEDLIQKLLDNLHDRKPLVSFGHNQVYDWTQLREAASDSGITFDPAIKDIKPRRDFVRYFLQRLKQDLIYFDTLWLTNIFSPHLKQRSFGSSLRLEDVAKSRNIDFEKSLSHEELRIVELQRIAGLTPEIRAQAAKQMLFYSSADLDVTKQIAESMDFLLLITRLKSILPYCTLSEIAFSTNCMKKYLEQQHFQRSGNLPFYGYKSKEREDQLQIFKRRFAALKREMLLFSGLKKAEKGEYEEVSEFYFPLERNLPEVLFAICPDLQQICEETRGEEESQALSQYLKSFLSPVLADYYFARREKKVFDFANNIAHMQPREVQEAADRGLLTSLLGSFRFLKNHFRSVYASVDGEARRLIATTKKNLADLEYPEIMEKDADLFLLRKNAERIREKLSPAKRRDLTAFLTNFKTFDELAGKMGVHFDKLYAYIQFSRMTEESKRFFARYGFSIEFLKGRISEAYQNLACEIRAKSGRFLESRGDYLFIEGQETLDCGHRVRKLERYRVGKEE